MKRLLLVLILSLSALAQRLPDVAAPDHYWLNFAPDFTNDTFAGDETIALRVLKPTTTITLNSAEIDIQEATLTVGDNAQPAKITPLADKEMVEFTFPSQLAPGAASLHIKYSAKLNEQLRGLYLSKKNNRKYAVTQFEATDARRAFPSFDEPAYKAVFEVSATIDAADTAISNGKIISDAPGPGAGKHTLKFSPSPKMSSYLVALAIGDWECIGRDAEGGIPIRICSVPGTKEKMGFALDSAVAIMNFYNRYFSIKYPYGKLDVLGAPDFSAGAMENTALIISRDVLIVSDPKHASTGELKGVASVMAHEMAHQWFGDLVTMQWWDDIWLNEGFATWMEDKPLESWKPEWHIEIDEVQGTAGAMNVDSTATTRPIHAQHAETPGQIDELFDGIAYGKAAAVLRMVERYLGPEAFRAGVNHYLSTHKYANATAADFWNAMTDSSRKPVDQIMPSFVNQPGVPIVDVQPSCTAGSTTVNLSQRRYFSDRALFDKGSPESWNIPMCVKTADGATTCQTFGQKQGSVKLSGCPAWVFGNAHGLGYYRTGLTRDAVRKIAADAEKALTPGERVVLLNDEWSLVRIGEHSVSDYLEVASQFKRDRVPQVQQMIASRLGVIADDLLTDADRAAFETWVRRQYRPLFEQVGWKSAPNDAPDVRELRDTVLFALARYGNDPQVISEAHNLAQQYLRDPASVSPDLADTVLFTAARNGDAALYDQLLAKLKSASDPQQYYRYFYVLAAFRDPALMRRTLQFAISGDVRNQDSAGLIVSVMGNPAGHQIGWDFIRQNWPAIQQHTPPFGGQAAYVGAGAVFCDAQHRDQVQQFWAQHPVRNADRALKQAVDQINSCIDLRNQQAPKLAEWLQHHAASGAGE